MKILQKLLFVIFIMTVTFSMIAGERSGKIIVQFKADEVGLSTLSTRNAKNILPKINIKKIERMISDDTIDKITKRIEKVEQKKNKKTRTITDNKALNKLFIIEPDQNQSLDEILAALNSDPRVLYAEPDMKLQTTALPNDPNYSSLWGISKIQAYNAWDFVTDTKELIVAVIDSGVDTSHPDLNDNCIAGYDFVNNDSTPEDDVIHGTHCAGILGAEGNNNRGVVGVAWKTKIMPLKIISNTNGTTSHAIQAIDYATANGASIMSNSWGWESSSFSQSVYDAIKRAQDANILFVAGAGNEGRNSDSSDNIHFYPSDYNLDNIISVANSNSSDRLDSSSNYGHISVDLSAPGELIYSTTPGNSYGYMSGTSMATPHVTGVAALLKTINPSWGYQEIKNCIMENVDPVSSLSGKCVTGGRLNAYKAVLDAREYQVGITSILYGVILNNN